MENIVVQLKDGSIVKQLYGANGIPLRSMVIKSKKAKVFASYQLIKKDLDLMESSLNAFQNEMPNIIKQSITFFAVINYAKCFVSNKSNRTILDHKTLFKDADERIKTLHKAQIDLRMDYVAHPGNTFEKCAITATLHPADVSYNELIGFSVDTNLAYMHSLNKKSIEDLKDLYNYVKLRVMKKLSELETQIQQELYELGDDELINRSIIPIEERSK